MMLFWSLVSVEIYCVLNWYCCMWITNSDGNANVQITASLAIQFDEPNHNVKYCLCGIIYHGSFHFTARIIDKAMDTYYYDGMKAGPECILEGKFNTILNIHEVEQRKASTLIYTLLWL